MKRFIISAPFGNYLTDISATSTLGTFTMQNRAGFLRWRLFWRLLRTLRYHRAMGGWTNKLGLPNPGIQYLQGLQSRKHTNLMKRLKNFTLEEICGLNRFTRPLIDSIVSIHGFSPEDWDNLLEILAKEINPGWVELNISCPNIGHLSVPEDLFKKAVSTKLGIIVKLPPVNYWETFLRAYDAGVNVFHCTNTLPCRAGGLSGKALQGVALDVVRRVKEHDRDLFVIGGGGITGPEDVKRFRDAGASSFAVGSALLNPALWLSKRREKFFTRLGETDGSTV